ncbi:MAG: hypothetical protein ABL962_16180, partial [Fimbriimonadaceae bacterium]
MILALTCTCFAQSQVPIHFRQPVMDYPLASLQKGLSFRVAPGDGKTPYSFVRLDIFRDDVLVRSEPFGNHSDVFEKFWGDPQQPPFIVVRTGMRSVLYDLILPWWKPHSVTYRYISYVSREGVIGGRYLYSTSRADSETGRVRWERIFQIGVVEVEKTNRGVWTTL